MMVEATFIGGQPGRAVFSQTLIKAPPSTRYYIVSYIILMSPLGLQAKVTKLDNYGCLSLFYIQLIISLSV